MGQFNKDIKVFELFALLPIKEFEQNEEAVKEVYDFCPPTKTSYASDEIRNEYKEKWGKLLTDIEMKPSDFVRLLLLDIGCGSCEKATFYHEWGAHVTGLDMSASVLKEAKNVVGDRDIELIHSSIFNLSTDRKFDIVIADGVLHHTFDTFQALKCAVSHLKPGGHIILSLINVRGRFWWFPFARLVTRVLGGSDFHKRAAWGVRLFKWTRGGQEGTRDSAEIFRSESSWAYDWFANPTWNIHFPAEIRGWLKQLGLEHIQSTPSIIGKENPRNPLSFLFKQCFGKGILMLDTYMLINRESNMVYIHAKAIA